MPICSGCCNNYPDDAFSQESQPLCEYCYEQELEEEAAGGEIGNDHENVVGNDDDDDDDDVESNLPGHDQTHGDGRAARPKKVISLAGAARILDAQSNVILTVDHHDHNHDDDGDRSSSSSSSNIVRSDDPPDIGKLDDLVYAIHHRGYNVGYGLDSWDVLKFRLERVLFDPDNHVIRWLTVPLVHVLLEGPDSPAWFCRFAPLHVSESVMERQSLLHWVCQWKLLRLQCGWRGHDDMVHLCLRAGANVHETLRNGCTPLFFAVKYGSVDTVRLLLDAGANPLHKDCRQQTCLRNALPQASPYILQLLLQHVPADETFLVTDMYTRSITVTPTTTTKKKKKNKQKKKKTTTTTTTRINALDILLTEFVTPQPDVSWATLGLPSVEDYAQCMLLFLHRGIQISPHYPDATFFLGQYLQGAMKAVKRLYYTRKIADFMFGQWLPDIVREVTLLQDDNNNMTAENNMGSLQDRSCQRCNNNNNNNNTSQRNLVNLSCGHCLCQDCITDMSQTATGGDEVVRRPQCPYCSHPLGLDIVPSTTPLLAVETETKKISRNEQRRQALSRLDMTQLQFECEARNLVVVEKHRKDHCVESLVHDWHNFILSVDDDDGGNLDDENNDNNNNNNQQDSCQEKTESRSEKERPG